MRRAFSLVVVVLSVAACHTERAREPRRKRAAHEPEPSEVAAGCEAYRAQAGTRRVEQYVTEGDAVAPLCALTDGGALQCAEDIHGPRYEVRVPEEEAHAMFSRAEQHALRLGCPACAGVYLAKMCKGTICIPICQYVPHMAWLHHWYGETRAPTDDLLFAGF